MQLLFVFLLELHEVNPCKWFFDQVKAVATEMGIGFLGIGFQPKWGLKDIPVMPKVQFMILFSHSNWMDCLDHRRRKSSLDRMSVQTSLANGLCSY